MLQGNITILAYGIMFYSRSHCVYNSGICGATNRKNERNI